MGWLSNVAGQASKIGCDTCSAITQKEFFGKKDTVGGGTKAGGAHFDGGHTHNNVACPCCQRRQGRGPYAEARPDEIHALMAAHWDGGSPDIATSSSAACISAGAVVPYYNMEEVMERMATIEASLDCLHERITQMQEKQGEIDRYLQVALQQVQDPGLELPRLLERITKVEENMEERGKLLLERITKVEENLEERGEHLMDISKDVRAVEIQVAENHEKNRYDIDGMWNKSCETSDLAWRLGEYIKELRQSVDSTKKDIENLQTLDFQRIDRMANDRHT